MFCPMVGVVNPRTEVGTRDYLLLPLTKHDAIPKELTTEHSPFHFPLEYK